MSDYIKRDDAIEAFDPRQRRDWYTPWIVETLKDLPSADVAPVRHGWWVEDKIQNHVEKTFHCSECDFQAWGEDEKTHYCGNCGARMDAKE